MSPYETEAEKEQDTFTNIKYYYSHVANGVSLLFISFRTPSIIAHAMPIVWWPGG